MVKVVLLPKTEKKKTGCAILKSFSVDTVRMQMGMDVRGSSFLNFSPNLLKQTNVSADF